MSIFSKRAKHTKPTNMVDASGNTLHYPKRRRKKKIILGACVVAFIILGWMAYSAFRAAGRISENGFSAKDLLQMVRGNSTLKGAKEGRTNILFLGYGGKGNPGGTLADTDLLFSYNYADKKVALVSFPRDLYVPIGKTGSYNKLNYAYASGEENPKATGGGGTVASETIANITDVPVHYYVSMDFVGFVKLIDTLGGVSVNVEKAINDPYYPDDRVVNGEYIKTNGYSPFKLSAGVQKFDGSTALKFARSRETTSDFDRARRQQVLLEAIKDKATSVGVLSNPKKVVDIINVLGGHLRTNLSVAEAETFVGVAKEIKSDNITNKVLDNSASGLLVEDSGDVGYYLKPKVGNFSQIKSLVKNIFSNDNGQSNDAPKQTASTGSSIKASGKIEIQNATGVTGKAKDLSKKLTGQGMTVVNLTTAPETRSDTILYDYTGGKNENAVALIKAKLPGVNATVLKNSGGSTTLDFKLVLGEDSAGV